MTLTIKIPLRAQVLVSKGDKIEPGTPLFEQKNKKNITVNIAEKLKIKPDLIFRYLDKIIGEDVQKGEILASKKGMFKTRKVLSTHEAIIKEVSHITGEITLLIDDDSESHPNVLENTVSGLKGTIERIDATTITIALKGAEAYPVKNVTADYAAELFYFTNDGLYFTANEDQLKNKLVVIDELKAHIEVKCEALGCVGFLYLSGKPTTQLPSASFIKKDVYDTMIRQSKKYGAFTTTDSLVAVYN